MSGWKGNSIARKFKLRHYPCLLALAPDVIIGVKIRLALV
jgi:hypothetical protein